MIVFILLFFFLIPLLLHFSRFAGPKLETYCEDVIPSSEFEWIQACAIAVTASHRWSERWAKATDNAGWTVVSPRTLWSDCPMDLHVTDRCAYDPTTGLKVVCYHSSIFHKTFLVLGSVYTLSEIFGDEDPVNLWYTVGYNLLGGVPRLYRQAADAIRWLQQARPSRSFCLGGHCLGGSLACYTGLLLHLPVMSFNTLPFGAGLQQELGEDRLLTASKWLTHICVEDDFFADTPYSNALDRFLSTLRVRTPGNWGRRMCIPAAKAYRDLPLKERHHSIHNYFLSSWLEFNGLPYRSI